MARVLLAMSGGVDSSVSAHLLRAAGHEVVGVFMRHGEAAPACDDDSSLPIVPAQTERLGHKQGCCTASDAADARRVADRLEIPFYALDLREEFGRIIDYFVEEYSAGRTPNPCVACNNWIKFGRLFDYSDSVGAEFVATGHYARLTAEECGASPALRMGVDPQKDQSYVLFGIEARLLSRMMLPVGDYRKDQIRALAREMNLRVADKRDSQEICFVTSGDHADFVRKRRGEGASGGEIVTTDGAVVGTHLGIEGFTIGQRKGLGVALGEPRFVVSLDAKSNRVVLGAREELARSELTAGRTNWLMEPPAGPFEGLVKIRYNAARVGATISVLPGARLHVAFDAAQYGVAPGQAVVCYDGDRVLGGGWIE